MVSSGDVHRESPRPSNHEGPGSLSRQRQTPPPKKKLSHTPTT
jgi:hypothetical protein